MRPTSPVCATLFACAIALIRCADPGQTEPLCTQVGQSFVAGSQPKTVGDIADQQPRNPGAVPSEQRSAAEPSIAPGATRNRRAPTSFFADRTLSPLARVRLAQASKAEVV